MTARLVLIVGTLAACEPRQPTCSDVSRHVGRMFEPADMYSQEIEGVFLGRCVNDSWSVDVRRCITSTRSLDDPKSCKAKLTPPQAAALDKDLALAEEHELDRAIPKPCLDLEVQVAAAMSCEAIAKSERDRIMKQFTLTKASWQQVKHKRLLAPTCGAAIQALKQATNECKPGSSKTPPGPSPGSPSAPK